MMSKRTSPEWSAAWLWPMGTVGERNGDCLCQFLHFLMSKCLSMHVVFGGVTNTKWIYHRWWFSSFDFQSKEVVRGTQDLRCLGIRHFQKILLHKHARCWQIQTLHQFSSVADRTHKTPSPEESNVKCINHTFSWMENLWLDYYIII